MNTIKSGDKIMANWMWIAIGAAALLMFIVVMWITSSTEKPRAKIDANQTAQSVNSGAGPIRGYPTPPQAPSPPVFSEMPPVTTPSRPLSGNSPAVVKITPQPNVPVPSPKPPASAIRGMFPMGNVLASSSYAPQRKTTTAKEIFQSFSYEGRLWQFTGKYAYIGQIDITPTGFELDHRKVYAFANTAAPDKILFVQSMRDPNRYAIYR